jgi:hypothetical protein
MLGGVSQDLENATMLDWYFSLNRVRKRSKLMEILKRITRIAEESLTGSRLAGFSNDVTPSRWDASVRQGY